MKVKNTWWKDAFGKNIFPLEASEKQFKKLTPIQVKFIIKKVGLKPGSQVLDLCCGTGRHSVLLAKASMNVTGVDYSNPYLKRARKMGRKLPIRWILHDMRKIRFKNEFDCVINMWSSFGYFSAADNKRTVRKIYQSLKPGGQFFIDTISADFLKKNFIKNRWYVLPDGSFGLEEGVFDQKNMCTYTQWYFISRNGKIKSMRSRIELFGRTRMDRLLRDAGFKKIKFYSDFEKGTYKKNSYRLIAIAQK